MGIPAINRELVLIIYMLGTLRHVLSRQSFLNVKDIKPKYGVYHIVCLLHWQIPFIVAETPKASLGGTKMRDWRHEVSSYIIWLWVSQDSQWRQGTSQWSRQTIWHPPYWLVFLIFYPLLWPCLEQPSCHRRRNCHVHSGVSPKPGFNI